MVGRAFAPQPGTNARKLEMQDPKKPDATVDVDVAEPARSAGPLRPYSSPRLRRLGSVRDLTLGSPRGAQNDFRGGLKP